jgi:hypothetical protein
MLMPFTKLMHMPTTTRIETAKNNTVLASLFVGCNVCGGNFRPASCRSIRAWHENREGVFQVLHLLAQRTKWVCAASAMHGSLGLRHSCAVPWYRRKRRVLREDACLLPVAFDATGAEAALHFRRASRVELLM